MLLSRLICFLLAGCSLVQAQGSGLRPYKVEDLFRREDLGQTALTPDGRQMAFVLTRSVLGETSKNGAIGSNAARSDIWIVETETGRKENITLGHQDGWGYWKPVWSPDSNRLAMLSNREGKTRLWLWDRLTKKLKRISDTRIKDSLGTVAWLSNDSLICITLPEDQDASDPFANPTRQWSKFREGRTSSASVFESGGTRKNRDSGSKIVILNVLSGQQTDVEDGAFDMIAKSPDGRFVALRKLGGTFVPAPDEPISYFRPRPYYLTIISVEGRVIFRSKELADRGLPVRPDTSYQWSPDSKVLTGLARDYPRSGDTEWGTYVFRYMLGSESLDRLDYPGFVPSDTMWNSEGQLFVRGASEGQRARWFSIADSKLESVQLTEGSAGAVINQDGSFFTIIDGQIWQVKNNGRTRDKVVSSIDSKVTRIWSSGDRHDHAVLYRDGQDFFVLDPSTLKPTLLRKPSADASLVSFSNRRGVAVFRADSKNGTYLWISKVGTNATREILKTNTFLSSIEETTNWKKINYRSTYGSELEGWLLLPTGYQEGRSYPIVTWVYAGNVYSGSPKGSSIVSEVRIPAPLNLQFLTARGYTVFLPSIPLAPYGAASDPYTELVKGVVPGVDKLLEMGVADPRRIGVMGFSYGGYSVYSLITQTNRFRAAVAVAGFTDLTSNYLSPDPVMRNTGQDYTDGFPHLALFKMALAETGQVGMGNPPWKDPERYMRNSPVLHADQVQTPILMIHGDMDTAVPIEQAEEFFTAMYRQGKPARLLRYWGEGHGIESPANIRDMWDHTYFWFDRFLNISRDENGKMVWEGSEVKPIKEKSDPKQ